MRPLLANGHIRKTPDSTKEFAPSVCRTKGRLVVPPAFILTRAITGAARLSYGSEQFSKLSKGPCESNRLQDKWTIYSATTGGDFAAFLAASHHPADLWTGRRLLVSVYGSWRDYTKFCWVRIMSNLFGTFVLLRSSLSGLTDAFTLEYLPWGQEQDLHIQPE